MRRVVVVLLAAAVLFSGCSLLKPVIPEPDEPQNPQTGDVVFETESGYRIAGLLWHERTGLVVTSYKVDRNPMRSRVYLNAQNGRIGEPFENDCETIGQPFFVGGVLYFPQEHGERCLFWDEFFGHARPSPGRWNVCGFAYNGRPGLAFNDSYSGTMQDNPRIIDPFSGEVWFEVPAHMMPRSMVEWKEAWWVAGDTGEEGTYTYGLKYAGNITHMAVLGDQLYGAGKDGAIYRMGNNGWTDRMATEAGASMAMFSTDDRILYTGGRPNRLYELKDGELTLLSKDDTPDTGGNFFGNAVAYDSERSIIYWAYWNAVRSRGIVVRLQ